MSTGLARIGFEGGLDAPSVVIESESREEEGVEVGANRWRKKQSDTTHSAPARLRAVSIA